MASDFDGVLKDIAKNTRTNAEVDDLGTELKISVADIGSYQTMNGNGIKYDGSLKMLRDWNKTQHPSTVKETLIRALEKAGRIDLREKHFSSPVARGKGVGAGPDDVKTTAEWPGNNGDYSTTQMDVFTSYLQTSVDSDDVYKMKSKPRGQAIIVNNKNFTVETLRKRSGTDVDCRNLENVFKQLGFNVIVHRDLKGRGIQGVLEQLRRDNHSTFDCFIFAILTHGIDGAVYGTDGHPVKIEDIVAQFTSDRCPTLTGKPKLFFFQACRGEQLDEGIVQEAGDAGDEIQKILKMELDSTDSFASSRSKMPSQSDVLLAYATVPGFVSWRNAERGSWFIQALTEFILQHAKEEDLLSMITMVNSKVARAFESSSGRHKQMPAPVTMLTKKLYFFPGHYE